LERLTVVLNGGELNDTRRRVVETSNAERLEHHLERVKGSCRVDHSMRKGDVAKEVKPEGEAVVIPYQAAAANRTRSSPSQNSPANLNPA